MRKGYTEISSFLRLFPLGAQSVLLCVEQDTKLNLLDMAFFVLISRVTLSPWSCDVDERAKAILKEGFVLDLETP